MQAFTVILTLLVCIGRSFAEPNVQFGNTTLVGRSIATLGQEFFGGIPFAEPPLGNLRFEPPVPKFSLDVSTFDASSFGLACPQRGLNTSEDCLTLNILRPSGIPANASLPVMVWVFGGGFADGDASVFNASAIVAQSVLRGTPIVYVNLNYRLGALGFPQGSEVVSRNALNLGLKDQLLAFEWVQRNIHFFGGDRSKVTAFGQSAGAISLSILYMNPGFAKLARAVIFESGHAATTPAVEGARREDVWETFVAAVPECANARKGNTFACLRNANVADIVSAATVASSSSLENFVFVPVIDGPDGVFPTLPSRALSEGAFAPLPFIAGTNKDEGTSFIPTSVNSTEELRALTFANTMVSQVPSAQLTGVVDQLFDLYPDVPALGSPFDTGNETFGLSSQFKRAAALLGDISFQSQRRAWIQAASSRGVKTFGYLFTDNPGAAFPLLGGSPELGVQHGLEVLYVYGATSDFPPSEPLSQTMIDYWVSFATSLDPNDKYGNITRPTWNAYTPENQAVIELNSAGITMIPDSYRADQISFINSVPEVLSHKRDSRQQV